MSESSEVITPVSPALAARRGGLLAGVCQLTYAWVGMWGVTSEDLGHFYQRCVARGEQILNARPTIAQPEVKPPAPDAAVAPPKIAASRRIRPISIVNAFGAVETYHFDLNAEGILPTKEEVNALIERVEVLARDVEALTEQRKQEN